MSDKTLGKARGLNTLTDPKAFKGSAGRAKLTKPKDEPKPRRSTPTADDAASTEAQVEAEAPAAPKPRRAAKKAPDPFPAEAEVDTERDRAVDSTAAAVVTEAASSAPSAAPHRAVVPGVQRKRRELSIPNSVAEALDATGINAADVVMAGYRRHGDAIYAGAGGRLAARGRTRLRLSISDAEFDQITRLGHARGWNRSETVSVILAMELIPTSAGLPGA